MINKANMLPTITGLIFNHLCTVKGLLFLKNGRLVDCNGFKHRPHFTQPRQSAIMLRITNLALLVQ